MKGQPMVRVTGSLFVRTEATGAREHAESVKQSEKARSRLADIVGPRTPGAWFGGGGATAERQSYSRRSKSFSAPERYGCSAVTSGVRDLRSPQPTGSSSRA